jgi:hypothetical protein
MTIKKCTISFGSHGKVISLLAGEEKTSPSVNQDQIQKESMKNW